MSKLDPYYYEELKQIMQERKEEVLRKISSLCHPLYAKDFAAIIHYSWQEGLPEAEKIAQDLNLMPIDFSALGESLEEFEDLLLEEIEQMRQQQYG